MNVKKKKHPKFYVPNFGTKSRKGVKERWRKQRGIDNKKRIKKRFMGAEPNIGHGNKKELRGVKINGKVNLLVRNKKEFQAALENPSADIVFAHSMSKKLRGEMAKIAEGKKVRITNFKTMIK
ncbi:eL32 family ribosomal protein [Candidatus Marsarchaeota archaeon]|jgi:ribosomal protein L32E|nr:eL32 family ribosomal protein [Candidatus Marsarchaeota archaeon]